MRTIHPFFGVAVALLLLSSVTGCTTMGVFGSSDDKYVVNTPRFADNRVFYSCGIASRGRSSFRLSLPYELWSVDGTNKLQAVSDCLSSPSGSALFEAGESINLVAMAVKLPAKASDSSSGETNDIAVVLDIHSTQSTESTSLVVWYQRGVLPGQTLNFSNLLLYHQDNWDKRSAPMIRLRVIDVTSERNEETRRLLTQVSTLGNQIPLALSNPFFGAALQVSTSAARLVLGAQRNRALLDYSVQFYPAGIASFFLPGTTLTPWRKGSFILLGRDPLSSVSPPWSDAYCYDESLSSVFTATTSDACMDRATRKEVASPHILIAAMPGELVVSGIVAQRSAYLQKLLSDSDQSNLDAVKSEAEQVRQSALTFVALEKLKRTRMLSELSNAVELLDPKNNIVSENQALILGFLNNIVVGAAPGTKCPVANFEQAKKLVSTLQSKATTFDSQGNGYRVSAGNCPPAASPPA